MDMRMPKVNGVEATRAILAENPAARIVAITATTDEAEKKACRDAGMIGFLPKPFSEKNLFDLILSVVDKPVQQEQPVRRSSVNINDLKKLTNNDPVFLKEMILLFIQSTEKGIIKIEKAIENENWRVISDTAHNLAPQCKHMQATVVYNNLKELEKNAGKEPINQDQIEVLFQNVKSDIQEINGGLKNFITREEKITGKAEPEQLKID